MPANDSWIYQGRDEKGRFGDGTSPQIGAADVASSGRGSALLPRMQAVAYGAVGHLASGQRTQYSAQLEHGGLARLSESMLAWSRATDLDRDGFRERFLDGAGSDELVDHLRQAAEGAAKATIPEQQRDAAGQLADAYQIIGADRWSRFMADAHERATIVSASTAGRTLLAQATTPNTATDASPDGNSPPTATPGRYVATNPQQWVGLPSVGAGECVDLVREAAHAPRTTDWVRGVQVQGDTNIRPGTAIATFDSNGRYTGHAAIYLGQDERGIRVIDQWNIRENGRVTGQHTPSERTLPFGQPWHDRIDRGEFYYVVE